MILVLLGVFLRSIGRPQTHWTFEDTLTQIGLGYGFLYLIAQRSARVQWTTFAIILIGYWLAFALYPLPGPDFNWRAAGVSPDWVNNLTGFSAHWNKNTNVAWAFDNWFLNLFPVEHPFTRNEGGYCTLSFIPTLGTMILGLFARHVIISGRAPRAKVKWLVIAGLSGLAAGMALGWLEICPVVKRIWTPGWTLFSGGCALLFIDRILCADGSARTQALGFSPHGDRHELHRRLLYRSFVSGLHRAKPDHPPWGKYFQLFRRSL